MPPYDLPPEALEALRQHLEPAQTMQAGVQGEERMARKQDFANLRALADAQRAGTHDRVQRMERLLGQQQATSPGLDLTPAMMLADYLNRRQGTPTNLAQTYHATGLAPDSERERLEKTLAAHAAMQKMQNEADKRRLEAYKITTFGDAAHKQARQHRRADEVEFRRAQRKLEDRETDFLQNTVDEAEEHKSNLQYVTYALQNPTISNIERGLAKLARTFGHTGVLTEKDVQSIKSPTVRDWFSKIISGVGLGEKNPELRYISKTMHKELKDAVVVLNDAAREKLTSRIRGRHERLMGFPRTAEVAVDYKPQFERDIGRINKMIVNPFPEKTAKKDPPYIFEMDPNRVATFLSEISDEAYEALTKDEKAYLEKKYAEYEKGAPK